jgi:hypothetical protein
MAWTGAGSVRNSEDAHLGAAVGAGEGGHLVDAGDEPGPAGAFGGGQRAGWRGYHVRSGRCGILDDRVLRIRRSVGREGDDPLSQACVGGEDAVIAVAMDAGRRDEAAERLEEVEGREAEEIGTAGKRPSRPVEDAGDGDVPLPLRVGSDPFDLEALQGERGPRTIAQQPFPAGTVGAMNAHSGIETEPAGRVPAEHVFHRGLVQEAATLEETEHAELDGALEGGGMVGGEVGGLVEADCTVRLFAEEPVEDHDVEVGVGVQGRAEAVQEGDGAQVGFGGGVRSGAAEPCADGAEQDAEHCAGKGRITGQKRTQPLRQREHPLADRHGRQDRIAEVRRYLDHAPRVAGRADTAALAGERYEALRGAAVTA